MVDLIKNQELDELLEKKEGEDGLKKLADQFEGDPTFERFKEEIRLASFEANKSLDEINKIVKELETLQLELIKCVEIKKDCSKFLNQSKKLLIRLEHKKNVSTSKKEKVRITQNLVIQYAVIGNFLLFDRFNFSFEESSFYLNKVLSDLKNMPNIEYRKNRTITTLRNVAVVAFETIKKNSKKSKFARDFLYKNAIQLRSEFSDIANYTENFCEEQPKIEAEKNMVFFCGVTLALLKKPEILLDSKAFKNVYVKILDLLLEFSIEKTDFSSLEKEIISSSGVFANLADKFEEKTQKKYGRIPFFVGFCAIVFSTYITLKIGGNKLKGMYKKKTKEKEKEEKEKREQERRKKRLCDEEKRKIHNMLRTCSKIDSHICTYHSEDKIFKHTVGFSLKQSILIGIYGRKKTYSVLNPDEVIGFIKNQLSLFASEIKITKISFEAMPDQYTLSFSSLSIREDQPSRIKFLIEDCIKGKSPEYKQARREKLTREVEELYSESLMRIEQARQEIENQFNTDDRFLETLTGEAGEKDLSNNKFSNIFENNKKKLLEAKAKIFKALKDIQTGIDEIKIEALRDEDFFKESDHLRTILQTKIRLIQIQTRETKDIFERLKTKALESHKKMNRSRKAYEIKRLKLVIEVRKKDITNKKGILEKNLTKLKTKQIQIFSDLANIRGYERLCEMNEDFAREYGELLHLKNHLEELNKYSDKLKSLVEGEFNLIIRREGLKTLDQATSKLRKINEFERDFTQLIEQLRSQESILNKMNEAMKVCNELINEERKSQKELNKLRKEKEKRMIKKLEETPLPTTPERCFTLDEIERLKTAMKTQLEKTRILLNQIQELSNILKKLSTEKKVSAQSFEIYAVFNLILEFANLNPFFEPLRHIVVHQFHVLLDNPELAKDFLKLFSNFFDISFIDADNLFSAFDEIRKAESYKAIKSLDQDFRFVSDHDLIEVPSRINRRILPVAPESSTIEKILKHIHRALRDIRHIIVTNEKSLDDPTVLASIKMLIISIGERTQMLGQMSSCFNERSDIGSSSFGKTIRKIYTCGRAFHRNAPNFFNLCRVLKGHYTHFGYKTTEKAREESIDLNDGEIETFIPYFSENIERVLTRFEQQFRKKHPRRRKDKGRSGQRPFAHNRHRLMPPPRNGTKGLMPAKSTKRKNL